LPQQNRQTAQRLQQRYMQDACGGKLLERTRCVESDFYVFEN
jgi:D-arabinose 5-phosphate isomerase GutQ